MIKQRNTSRFSKDKIIYKLKRQLLKFRCGSKLEFGLNLRILGGIPLVKTPKNGKIEIGDNVVLNSDFKRSNTALTTKVKFVTGYEGKIKIGDNCDLNGTCFVAYEGIEIGDYCQFASSSIICDTDFHPVDTGFRLKQMEGNPFPFESVSKKKIKIGNNVWVGWGVTILKGVCIGEGSIIAAGSVVTSNIPPNCIAAGNPAKIVKQI